MPTPSPYATRQCSNCQGDTKFICTSCRRDLCSNCKEEHVIDINTIDHDVMIFRRKMTSSPIQENCAIHSDNVYDKYCETCELPMCSSCSEHTEHKNLDIKSLYDSHHQRLRKTFNVVRGKIHLYESVFMTGIKADVKTCQKEMCKGNASLILNATRLKDIVDKALCDVELIHKCFVQNLKRHRHISSLVCSEHSFEQSAKDPVKFLLSKSAFRTLKERYGCAKHAKLSVTKRLNAKGVTMLLSDIKVTEGRKRPMKIEPKLMPAPVLQKFVLAKDVDFCSHMAFVTSDKIWIGCKNNFYLTDTNGNTLFHQEGPKNEFSFYNPTAYFTITHEKNLIFIDKEYNIVKLSQDMEKITTLIETPYNHKGPCCVYFAPFAGDLLVGILGSGGDFNQKVWINRYNELGQVTKTIQCNESGYPLFSHPSHIAENNNGDIAVSDRSRVVVTDCGGKHRFSYHGGPSHFGLIQGLCTDSLSHILVCDSYSSSVHMINKDGHFLKYLLMRPSGILTPSSLTIDVNTHLLWVGSSSLNTVIGYRYITQYDSTNGKTAFILIWSHYHLR